MDTIINYTSLDSRLVYKVIRIFDKGNCKQPNSTQKHEWKTKYRQNSRILKHDNFGTFLIWHLVVNRSELGVLISECEQFRSRSQSILKKNTKIKWIKRKTIKQYIAFKKTNRTQIIATNFTREIKIAKFHHDVEKFKANLRIHTKLTKGSSFMHY